LAQAKSTITRCRRLLEVHEDYARRVAEVGGHVRLTRIIQGIFTSPFVRVAQLAKRLDVTYPTAKSDIDRLVQAGVLHELPNVTPKTFYTPAVFKVSYDELGNEGQAPSDEP
jgi:hypothetical protein